MIAYLIIGFVIGVSILLYQTTPTTSKDMLGFILAMSVFWPIYFPVFVYSGAKQIQYTRQTPNWTFISVFVVFSFFVLSTAIQFTYGMIIEKPFLGALLLIVLLAMIFVYGITYLLIYQLYKTKKK